MKLKLNEGIALVMRSRPQPESPGGGSRALSSSECGRFAGSGEITHHDGVALAVYVVEYSRKLAPR